MKLLKSKNKFKEVDQMLALNIIVEQCDKYFIGDEMLVANKNMHFLDDEIFSEIFNRVAKADIYKGMAWRVHNLLWAAQQALHVDGCFIECGVFRGFKSYFLLSYLKEKLSNRDFILCDTYEGIDVRQSHLSPISNDEHNKENLYSFILHRFCEFRNVIVNKGIVPNSLYHLNIDKVAFLHLDMNSYKAEISALDYLWPKIPIGGVIVLDDFGLYSHRAQMEKELPWFKNKNQNILELPTGQGIIIKQEK